MADIESGTSTKKTGTGTNKAGTGTKIWDMPIRLFHWLLAASVCFLLLSGETGFLFYDWHRNVGEFVIALLLFRLIWGFVGSSNARLLSLVVHPWLAFRHLRDLASGKSHPDRGHNPAGGWAVLVMLLILSFQAISGLFIADEDELVEGAFYGVLNDELSERLLHLHHSIAGVVMMLVVIHVLMVFVYLIRARQNLITPMITGHMQWSGNDAPPVVKFARPLIGLIFLLGSVGLIGVLVGWFA